jgi:SPP1 family predicted phage head-tail adaptor
MKLGKAKANYIDANTMTRVITLYRATRVSDGQGGYTTSFATTFSFWGDLRPNNQQRALDDLELQFDRSNKLYVRYTDDIMIEDEIGIDGVRYTIHSIKNVENQFRFLELVIYS